MILFIQVVLGSSIAVDVVRILPSRYHHVWQFTTGVLIVMLSAIAFIYKHNDQALLAGQLKKRYEMLINQLNIDQNTNVLKEMAKIEVDDIPIVGAFEEIAFKRTSIQLGLEDKKTLSCYQKLIALICGECFRK